MSYARDIYRQLQEYSLEPSSSASRLGGLTPSPAQGEKKTEEKVSAVASDVTLAEQDLTKQSPVMLMTLNEETAIEKLQCKFDILAEEFRNENLTEVIDAKYALRKAYEEGDEAEKSFYKIAVLAGFYQNVTKTERDQIAEEFRQNALNGDPEAQINYVSAILSDNSKTATAEEKKLAKHLLYWMVAYGYITDAQYLLGSYYFLDGKPEVVVNQSVTLAILWLKQAYLKGDVEARFLLARCYQQLSPLSHDKYDIKLQPALVEAERLFNKAFFVEGHKVAKPFLDTCQIEMQACQGGARAQLLLAKYYENGIGVTKNLPKAWGWYSAAAELGMIVDQDRLNAAREGQAAFKLHSWDSDGRKYYSVEDCQQTEREKAEGFDNPFAPKPKQPHRYGAKYVTSLRPKATRLLHETLQIDDSYMRKIIDRIDRFKSTSQPSASQHARSTP